MYDIRLQDAGINVNAGIDQFGKSKYSISTAINSPRMCLLTIIKSALKANRSPFSPQCRCVSMEHTVVKISDRKILKCWEPAVIH